jgi:hypothetical protein
MLTSLAGRDLPPPISWGNDDLARIQNTIDAVD